MTAGRNKLLTRYKVIVLGLKNKKGYPAADDQIVLKDRDVFFGYSYPKHQTGKYFDLWFTQVRDEDPENFVTLGRILRIEPPYHGAGAIYVTKLGRFYIQEMPNGWTNDDDKKHVHKRSGGKLLQKDFNQKEVQKGYAKVIHHRNDETVLRSKVG